MLVLDQFLRQDLVVELSVTDRGEALRELVAVMARAVHGMDVDDFLDRLLERETHSPTAVGMGIAMPHAKLSGLDQPCLAVGFSRQGIEMQAPDGQPVQILFLTAVGSDNATYLKLVARLAWLVRNPALRERLFEAASATALYEILASC